MDENNKKNEFIDRVTLALSRFHIIDKFDRADSAVARQRIASIIYDIMSQLANEIKDTKKKAKAATKAAAKVIALPDKSTP